MIYLFESNDDLALRGGGALTWDNHDEDIWGEVTPQNISNYDIADIIEMIGAPASEQVNSEYDEYRDERDSSERMAEQHRC